MRYCRSKAPLSSITTCDEFCLSDELPVIQEKVKDRINNYVYLGMYTALLEQVVILLSDWFIFYLFIFVAWCYHAF